MTLIVTRDVADRYRGFLASCALEVAPGVYTAPRMSAAVRERVWEVLQYWWHSAPGGSIVMTWADRKARGGQVLKMLGVPAKELAEIDGLLVVRSALPPGWTARSLPSEAPPGITDE